MSNLPESFLIKESRIKEVLKSISEFPIVFKGGTTLSMTYGVIERFSEDIDLSFYFSDANETTAAKKKVRNGLIKKVKELEWVKDIKEVESDIFVIFKNDAPVSEYDTVIKPNEIKLELQRTDKKRIKPYSSMKKPFEDADFEMMVADILSTYVDKVSLLIELFYAGKSGYLLDTRNTLARHIYDVNEIHEHLAISGIAPSISTHAKYISYIKARINQNLIKKENGRYVVRGNLPQTPELTKLIESGNSQFSKFESFIKLHKEAIIERIDSVVYPGAKKFNINKFLKVIKTNFQFYEKTISEIVNKKDA